jgi:hypothetical protein
MRTSAAALGRRQQTGPLGSSFEAYDSPLDMGELSETFGVTPTPGGLSETFGVTPTPLADHVRGFVRAAG